MGKTVTVELIAVLSLIIGPTQTVTQPYVFESTPRPARLIWMRDEK